MEGPTYKRREGKMGEGGSPGYYGSPRCRGARIVTGRRSLVQGLGYAYRGSEVPRQDFCWYTEAILARYLPAATKDSYRHQLGSK